MRTFAWALGAALLWSGAAAAEQFSRPEFSNDGFYVAYTVTDTAYCWWNGYEPESEDDDRGTVETATLTALLDLRIEGPTTYYLDSVSMAQPERTVDREDGESVTF